MVQWLRLCAPNAGSPGLISGQGTRSHMLQLRAQVPQLQIPRAATKAQCHQEIKVNIFRKCSCSSESTLKLGVLVLLACLSFITLRATVQKSASPSVVYPASMAAGMLTGRYFPPSRHLLQLPLRAWAPPPSTPHLEQSTDPTLRALKTVTP